MSAVVRDTLCVNKFHTLCFKSCWADWSLDHCPRSSSTMSAVVRESKKLLSQVPPIYSHFFNSHSFLSTNSIKHCSPPADVWFEEIGEIWESGTEFLLLLSPLLFTFCSCGILDFCCVSCGILDFCCVFKTSFMELQMCLASQYAAKTQ